MADEPVNAAAQVVAEAVDGSMGTDRAGGMIFDAMERLAVALSDIGDAAAPATSLDVPSDARSVLYTVPTEPEEA
jgi:hypothetical protein